MSYYSSSSNTDDVASATWPNPGAMGYYLYYPNLSVPQSTYPDLVSGPGYPSLSPTTEMGAFTNLPIQADFMSQVSGQCVGTLTWTYPAVPQSVLEPWSMPGPCMFLFLHLPLLFVFTGCESKAHFNGDVAVPQPQLVETGFDPLAAYSAGTAPEVSANNSDRRVLY